MVYIHLKNPKSIESKSVEKQIKWYIESGLKTKEILCVLEFIGTDELIKSISNEFRKKVNRIAFELDKNKSN